MNLGSPSRQRLLELQNEADEAGMPLSPIVVATLVLADTLLDVGDKLKEMSRDLERSIDSLDLGRDER